jgi:hypothetical protein
MAGFCSCVRCRNRLSVVCDCIDRFRYFVIALKVLNMAAPCKKPLVQATLFIDRPFIMTCIWRIHSSKPYTIRWSLVYNTSVFCFSHFHLEGVGGCSEPNETNFIWKKLSHFETIPKIPDVSNQIKSKSFI